MRTHYSRTHTRYLTCVKEIIASDAMDYSCQTETMLSSFSLSCFRGRGSVQVLRAPMPSTRCSAETQIRVHARR